MYNLNTHILDNPGHFQRLTCRGSLFTIFNCPLKNKYEDIWSHNNYVIYVLQGRKTWHTAHGSYDLCEGSCVFVRKGAAIVEQFFDATFCFFLFFVPDDFISEVLKSRTAPIQATEKKFDPIITISNSATVHSFFQSMMPYFDARHTPDQSLLELKFKELVLTIADNPSNAALRSFFRSLLLQPQTLSLKTVMEENFCFNLKLEDFARLSARSLSAFKRDFLRVYETTPGKWLMQKRLHHSLHLLTHMAKTVGEAAFESGFENASHFSRAFRQYYGYAPVSVKQHATTKQIVFGAST